MADSGGDTGPREELINVLYVDDEPDFAALAAEFLHRENDRFVVETEERAGEALDRLVAGGFDCVVSDYDMPEMNGLELLEAARERSVQLPFVLVTGKGSEEIASEAVSAGVTDYLRKRGGRERYVILANRIENAVSQYRAEREAAHHRRVSELVRDVTRALVGATSRDEVEQAVCDRVAGSEPYRFAWIGEPDPETERIRPRTTGGDDSGYLDAITVTVDGPRSRGPAGTALRENRVVVAQNVDDDPSFEPWREDALERGFHSVAGIPLAHDGTVYGVLLLYAAYANAFDETERALVADLGDAVGHAIEGITVRERLERQYQDLFELAPVMYVLTSEQDGHPVVTDCNQRVLDRLGYERDEVVGDSLADLYTEESATLLLDEGGYDRALDGEFTREERQLVASDGSVVETLLRAVPRYDTEGRTVGTLTLFVDVTERRRARTIATQAAAMDASMDGMAVFDDQGVYHYVNDAHGRIYDRDAADLVGETWRTLYDDAEVERLEREAMPLLATGESWQGEAVGRRADGSRFPQELSLSPLDDGRFVCVIRDSTERRKAKRELERQNVRLDEFASLVSHDLRNPLNIARGNVELARTDDATTDTSLDRAETALERMDRLIDDVLALARGVDEADLRPVSLRRTARSCWQGDDGSIEVVGDLRFLADRARLQRLLENLFRNSVEHGSTSNRSEAGDSGDHGGTDGQWEATSGDTVTRADKRGGRPDGDATVRVRLGPLGDEAGFFVADDGPGVPPEKRDAVFEFGHSTAQEGTGLGLGIVERIADAHGWECRLTEGTEGGARFEFAGITVIEGDRPQHPEPNTSG
ncbi:PAS domain S-box protein [Salinigranum halophilum]|uniref:PAS domain S-box protein n=1 Tax=Salinigranum halophilum TaxID=2565931 RepID=UPI00115CDC1D|nr:PAS domain S-box protein [Salinigranum halophilum]